MGNSRLFKILHRIEDSALVILLMIMITMAVSQIVMRNLFDTGILWGDILIRNLVLWIGLLGAMVASRDNDHICIDVITRYLPDKAKCAVDSLICLITAFICGMAAFYSFRFVKMEWEFGGAAFANVPVWICETIIPFAFTVICLRYLILSLNLLKSLFEEHS